MSTASFSQKFKQSFVSSDIDNFWKAYDKIISTKDSATQYKLLNELYINKGSEGLKSLMQVRNYTDKSFMDAIKQYPKFWSSIRDNTYKAKTKFAEIETAISKLKQAYPSLQPSTIYFSIGVFRAGGTILKNRVLIGSELSLADRSTVVHELPAWRQSFYKSYNPPIDDIALLCTHEYVHTQQKLPLDNLLCNTLYEGTAEFISCLATNKPSNTPSFVFAKKNEELVKRKFIEELFLPDRMYNWLWRENRNELKERDLGYYIGYRICEEYYNEAKNKQQAIKQMIELDYTNDSAVENLIDQSRFFSKSVSQLNAAYEASRPTVTGITPFNNGSRNVKPGLTTITVNFSKPLNGHNTGIDFGPLGESFCPKIKQDNKVWSADGKSWTFEAELKPNQHYQILISNNFRMENGVRLKPYLIDISTGD